MPVDYYYAAGRMRYRSRRGDTATLGVNGERDVDERIPEDTLNTLRSSEEEKN